MAREVIVLRDVIEGDIYTLRSYTHTEGGHTHEIRIMLENTTEKIRVCTRTPKKMEGQTRRVRGTSLPM